MKSPFGERDVLVVTDPQIDFCPGGALAVPGGDEIIPAINRLVRAVPHVIVTQDWHPAGHASFASCHPGRRPFDTIEASYGRRHCGRTIACRGHMAPSFIRASI